MVRLVTNLLPRQRTPRRWSSLLLVLAVASCGTASTPGSAGDPGVAPATILHSATATPAPELDVVSPITETSPPAAAPESLTDSISEALRQLRGPVPDEAMFLAFSFELHQQIASCMLTSGLEYFAYIFAGGMPDAFKRAQQAYEVVWEVPPDPTLARLAGMEPIQPTVAGEAGTLEPNTFYEKLDVTGKAAYDEQQAKCEASYVDPPEITELRTATEGVYRAFHELQGRAWNLDGFEALRTTYTRCMQTSADLSLTISDDLVDELDAFRGEHTTSPEAVAARGVELAVADASCRSPIYPQYLDLQPDAWRQWLGTVNNALPRIEELRELVRKRAPAPTV